MSIARLKNDVERAIWYEHLPPSTLCCVWTWFLKESNRFWALRRKGFALRLLKYGATLFMVALVFDKRGAEGVQKTPDKSEEGRELSFRAHHQLKHSPA